ncbi:hypothetical protein [Angelakisella massiliensis]|uniref:hypothetical protein n=1 Tax=Angelakisella massiliensis TaxID=1871018 RepID=UPI0024B051B5|nr:hypothetical protein [Angelakisella massiliensis]
MLKWMVPKPNRMLRRSRNGLGDRVLARHSLSPQQVSQEGTLTYLLPVRGEEQNLEEILSCLEVLARLLAHPRQAPSLYMVHLTHQIRLLLGMQNGLNVTQYQTVCGCYNQLVEQQQNPQPSFSSAEVLKSLAQVRSRLFVQEESISAPVMKKRSVSFTPREERVVLQSLSTHLYTLLRRHPDLIKKEQRSFYSFLTDNAGRLERLTETRTAWSRVFSQLDQPSADQLLEHLRQEPFFELPGNEGRQSFERLTSRDQLVYWAGRTNAAHLEQLEKWIYEQQRIAPRLYAGRQQTLEEFFQTADLTQLDIVLEDLSRQGAVSQKELETLRTQIQQLTQTQQRVDGLERDSRELWERVQKLFATEFFTQSSTVKEQWLSSSLQENSFAVDFLAYAASQYLRQPEQQAPLELARHLQQSSPRVAQWLFAWAAQDPASLQSFSRGQSDEWNRTFLRWSRSPILRQWQQQHLPEISSQAWSDEETADFSHLRQAIWKSLVEHDFQDAQWDTWDQIADWTEQGLVLAAAKEDHPWESFRTLVWQQRHLQRETILPALRSFSFPHPWSEAQMEQWLHQADGALLQTVSAYLISQVQERGERCTPGELKLAESLERILCTAPDSPTMSQHQAWQSGQISAQLQEFLRQPDNGLASLLRPFLPEKKAGALNYFAGYVEQLSPQDLPRMTELLQAAPYLPGQEQLLKRSREMAGEYGEEIKTYLHSTPVAASLTKPAASVFSHQVRELLAKRATEVLPLLKSGKTGPTVYHVLEDVINRLEETPLTQWEGILDREETLVFLRQHAPENQEEQDQSVFSQAASVLEQIRGIWQQTMKEKDSSQSPREEKPGSAGEMLQSIRQQLKEGYLQSIPSSVFQTSEKEMLPWMPSSGEGEKTLSMDFSRRGWFLALTSNDIEQHLKEYVLPQQQEVFHQAVLRLRQHIVEQQRKPKAASAGVEEEASAGNGAPQADGKTAMEAAFTRAGFLDENGRDGLEYLMQYVPQERQEGFRQAVLQLRQRVLERQRGTGTFSPEEWERSVLAGGRSKQADEQSGKALPGERQLTERTMQPLSPQTGKQERNMEPGMLSQTQPGQQLLPAVMLLHRLSRLEREELDIHQRQRPAEMAENRMLRLTAGQAGVRIMAGAFVIHRNVHPLSSGEVRGRFRLAGYDQTSETYFIDSRSMEIVLTAGGSPAGEGFSFQYSRGSGGNSSQESVRRQEEEFAKLHQQLTTYEQQLDVIRRQQAKLAEEVLFKADQALMEQRFYRHIEEDIRLAAKRHGFG